MPSKLSVPFHGKMFGNKILIVKPNKHGSKKFTATKNDVLFDVFEVTCVLPSSHDTIRFPEIAVAFFQS